MILHRSVGPVCGAACTILYGLRLLSRLTRLNQKVRTEVALRQQIEQDLRHLYSLALNDYGKFDDLRQRAQKEVAKYEACLSRMRFCYHAKLEFVRLARCS